MKNITREDWLIAGNRCGKTATLYRIFKRELRNARRRELYRKKKEKE